MKPSIYISALAIALASCGGGGSSSSSSSPSSVSTPTPSAPNQAPTITSASSVMIAEFKTGTVYTLEANDSDGTIAQYAMSPAGDSSFFTLDSSTGKLHLASPLTTPADANSDGVYDLTFTATDNDNASVTSTLAITVADAGPAPSTNFDLLDWKLDLPVDSAGNPSGDNLTISESNMAAGYESQFFYTDFDGGMVFRSPSQGATTSANTIYTRTELREMLRRGNTSISTRGSGDAPNLNNWTFSTAPAGAQSTAGGIDGTLCATLAVNEVTTTGESFEIGRVIIGQIHAADDEPIRLYYRKLPGNTNGTIYAAHEISGGEDIYYNIIGSRDNNEPNPINGFELNERFSYIIHAEGNFLDVEILQNGAMVAETTIDMSASGYDVSNDFQYFKAGVYHVNNDADPNEAAQATFYQLENNHNGYGFNTSTCARTTP